METTAHICWKCRHEHYEAHSFLVWHACVSCVLRWFSSPTFLCSACGKKSQWQSIPRSQLDFTWYKLKEKQIETETQAFWWYVSLLKCSHPEESESVYNSCHRLSSRWKQKFKFLVENLRSLSNWPTLRKENSAGKVKLCFLLGGWGPSPTLSLTGSGRLTSQVFTSLGICFLIYESPLQLPYLTGSLWWWMRQLTRRCLNYPLPAY